MKPVVSYSEVVSYMKCPRAYYYHTVQNWRPITEPEAINRGSAGHVYLQEVYREYRKTGDLERSKKLAKKTCFDEKAEHFRVFSQDNILSASNGILMAMKYFQQADVYKPEDILIVDEPLYLDFGDYWIGFTPDILVKTSLDDFKFVSKLWPQSKITRFTQTSLYRLWLDLMGYEVKRERIIFVIEHRESNNVVVKDVTSNEAARQHNMKVFDRYAREIISLQGRMSEYSTTFDVNVCNFCYYEQPCTLQINGKKSSSDAVLNSLYEQVSKRYQDTPIDKK